MEPVALTVCLIVDGEFLWPLPLIRGKAIYVLWIST